MTSEERALIKELDKCDFRSIHKYFLEKTEERKAMSKEEKLVRDCPLLLEASHFSWFCRN